MNNRGLSPNSENEYIYIHICAHVIVCTYIYIYIYMYVNIHMYIYIYIHMCIYILCMPNLDSHGAQDVQQPPCVLGRPHRIGPAPWSTAKASPQLRSVRPC